MRNPFAVAFLFLCFVAAAGLALWGAWLVLSTFGLPHPWPTVIMLVLVLALLALAFAYRGWFTNGGVP